MENLISFADASANTKTLFAHIYANRAVNGYTGRLKDLTSATPITDLEIWYNACPITLKQEGTVEDASVVGISNIVAKDGTIVMLIELPIIEVRKFSCIFEHKGLPLFSEDETLLSLNPQVGDKFNFALSSIEKKENYGNRYFGNLVKTGDSRFDKILEVKQLLKEGTEEILRADAKEAGQSYRAYKKLVEKETVAVVMKSSQQKLAELRASLK